MAFVPYHARSLARSRLPPLLSPRRPSTRMAISTNDLRPGTTIDVDGVPYKVLESLHVKPGKGAAFVRTKLKNMSNRCNLDKTFRAGELLQSAILEKINMQHTYMDGELYVFMNMETFEEERLDADQLGSTVQKFLLDGMKVMVLKYGEIVLGVEIPTTVTYKVTQTDPGLKGNTAQGGSTKPAIIETGAEVYVPLFVNTGDKIVVHTEQGKYVSRSKE